MRESLNLSREESEEVSFVPSALRFHEDLCVGVRIVAMANPQILAVCVGGCR